MLTRAEGEGSQFGEAGFPGEGTFELLARNGRGAGGWGGHGECFGQGGQLEKKAQRGETANSKKHKFSTAGDQSWSWPRRGDGAAEALKAIQGLGLDSVGNEDLAGC